MKRSFHQQETWLRTVLFPFAAKRVCHFMKRQHCFRIDKRVGEKQNSSVLESRLVIHNVVNIYTDEVGGNSRIFSVLSSHSDFKIVIKCDYVRISSVQQ